MADGRLAEITSMSGGPPGPDDEIIARPLTESQEINVLKQRIAGLTDSEIYAARHPAGTRNEEPTSFFELDPSHLPKEILLQIIRATTGCELSSLDAAAEEDLQDLVRSLCQQTSLRLIVAY